MIFLSGFVTDRVDDKVRMHMIGIAMCCNNDFKTGNCIRKLARNFMGNLRRDVFFR